MNIDTANALENFLIQKGKTQEEAYQIVKLLFMFLMSTDRHIAKDDYELQ